MYHLSERNDLDGVIFTPRIPDNYFTKNNYEENTTKRVCFSETIDGALSAMGQNLKNKIFYVYVPKEKPFHKKSNEEIISLVPDAYYTKECWVLEPVTLTLVTKIKVVEAFESSIFFEYGDKNGKKGEVCFWQWKEI